MTSGEFHEWQTVATANNVVQAEIIKNALEAEGYAANVENSYQAAEAGLLGVPVRIQVPTEQAERARKFIAEHEQARNASTPES